MNPGHKRKGNKEDCKGRQAWELSGGPSTHNSQTGGTIPRTSVATLMEACC